MPFLPALTGYLRREAGPSARLWSQHTGSRGERRRLSFVLSPELLEKMGWEIGQRFTVALGTGDDLGAFLIERAAEGIKLIDAQRIRGGRITITLPDTIAGMRPAEMIDRITLPASLKFEVQEGALILRAHLAHNPRIGNFAALAPVARAS